MPPHTLRSPAPAALPARLAAALAGADLCVPPFTPGTTNATPWYKALSPAGEVSVVKCGMMCAVWLDGKAPPPGSACMGPRERSLSIRLFQSTPAPFSPLHSPDRPAPLPHRPTIQYPLLVPADGSAPITGQAAILAALGAPPSSPGADQWFVLAASLAGPCASLVEPLAGERPAKDGEEAGAVAELKR